MTRREHKAERPLRESAVGFVAARLVGSEGPLLEALAPPRPVVGKHPQVTPSVPVTAMRSVIAAWLPTLDHR